MNDTLPDDDDDTAEWIIRAAATRYIAQGKTPDEAREIVIRAFQTPLPADFPTFDEL